MSILNEYIQSHLERLTIFCKRDNFCTVFLGPLLLPVSQPPEIALKFCTPSLACFLHSPSCGEKSIVP
jgi:hypothetical protein